VLRALVKHPFADDWVDRLVWSTHPPGRGR
jgi:hypothetical protein